MTREEAIYQIKQLAVLSTDKEIPKIAEALDMAIEALHREEAKEKGYCHRIRPKGEWPCNTCIYDYQQMQEGNE